MAVLDWVAGIVLFLQLPIPLYWFVMHPLMRFWRRRPHRSAFITGVLLSWPPVTACLILFRAQLFRQMAPPVGFVVGGIVLIVFEGWIFWRVKRDMGPARLVGKTELSGGGEIVRNGIYRIIRHPRYVGSLLAIVGACFIAATRTMWVIAAVWGVLMLAAIFLEEREMRERFGAGYADYCRDVPRFLPFRAKITREGRRQSA